MKKTDFSVLLRDGARKRLKQYSRLLSQSLTASFLLAMLLWQSPLTAQGCSLTCHNAQVSLGSECTAEVTVAMIGVTTQCVGGDFLVRLITLQGDTLPTPIVNENHIGQTLVASLVDLNSGNSCWSYITVEDKMAPTIVCENDTLSCLEFINWPGPDASDNCGEADVILLSENATLIPCDPLYVKMIQRTYIARDESGNESAPCTSTILLERIDFSLIEFPDSFTVADGDPLICNGLWADANHDGIPDPLDDGPYVGTGVPTIDGTPIYPEFIGFCNALTTYEDVVLPPIGCVQKIMRVWTVREWHCSGETDTLYIQLIEIVDNEGPEITCPADFTRTTTGHNCTATVQLPPALVSDACSDLVSVTVTYPGGFSPTNGGVFVNLPVGQNVITYIAYDQCYNSSSCTMTITIADLTPPIPVCDEHTVVSLTLGGLNGLTKVPAEVFDDGSWDACGPVTFRARRMDSCLEFDWTTDGAGVDEIPDGQITSRDHGTVFRSKVPFACCDAGGDPVMVVLEVTDASGNSNTCMVEVIVQDKIPPTITCPSDITVSCEYPIDLDNLDVFGTIVSDPDDVTEWCVYDPTNDYAGPDGFVCGLDGVVFDNCNVDIEVEVFEDINNCGMGYIQRTFIASDANGSSSCTQTIYIRNFDPIVGDSIIFPQDYHGAECALGTDPDDLPPGYDRPIINEDHCDLVGVNYEDLVFPIIDGACYKILRTWRVIEWCLYDEIGYLLEDYNYWEHVQVIKVTNTSGPRFLTEQPTIENCNSLDCSGLQLELIQRATDDCTPDELLQWSYAVDLDNDGFIDATYSGTGAVINASGYYPLGFHRILYSFEDRCGNRTVAEQFLNLASCKAPTPVCYHGLVADLMAVDTDGDGIEDDGMIRIWAKDFDASSYHACELPFVFSLAPDINVTYRDFTCADVGAPVPVRLYVTDNQGNQDYCETYIIIQDNLNICPEDGGLTGTITGNVSTESTDNILDVQIQLDGAQQMTINTNNTGTYTFPPMAVGASYTVNPGKDNDYKNGVSTLDLVHIQKHLLGIQNLDSPYKMIAADANDSKSITAVDLIELRRLILGIYEDLPNNASWRFVDKAYDFPNPFNPWEQAWPENRPLTPLAAGMNHANFYGIKIGDVNNSVKANANSIVTRGSGEVLDLVIDERAVTAGEVIEVPVYAAKETALEGLQFSFKLAGGLILSDVKGGLLNVTSDNFGWINGNTLTSSWSDAVAVSVNTSEPLFTLVFESKGAAQLSQVISMTKAPTEPEAYTANSDILDLQITFRGATDQVAFELLQNEPNPFTGRTEIGFVLPGAGQATLTVFDLAGRQLLNQTIDGRKGLNKVEVSKEQLNATGMVYYQIQFQGYSATKKMLIL